MSKILRCHLYRNMAITPLKFCHAAGLLLTFTTVSENSPQPNIKCFTETRVTSPYKIGVKRFQIKGICKLIFGTASQSSKILGKTTSQIQALCMLGKDQDGKPGTGKITQEDTRGMIEAVIGEAFCLVPKTQLGI